jgi:type VI secretion system protein ImpH
MDAAVGRAADAVAFFAELAEAPYRFDFYQTLRRLECLYDDQPRWGEALRPLQEHIRLGQDPDLSFAPAPLASFDPGSGGRPPRLQVRLFGLFGPNGPLPLHVTDYARERLLNAGDPTLCRFLDLFHHRFLALFYRAWAQAQPHVNYDRPGSDRFAAYIGAFIGLSPQAFRRRDSLPDAAKFFHVGALVRQVRNTEGLADIIRHFFRVPAEVQPFVGHWMALGPRERTYLARPGATLGAGAVLGRTVWDHQHKFRVRIGPLTLAQYERFLPVRRRAGRESPAANSPQDRAGRTPLEQLVDWVRLYSCMELDWDVRLCLAGGEVPSLKLGVGGRLGWTTWLGRRAPGRDADDLSLHPETFVSPAGVTAA